MAITLPFPVRLAAGILATGIDLVRALPEELPALPVALAGNAMRLSMKVQQEIATLATRGDELIGSVVGAPQESPAWAKFDDEPAEQVVRVRPPAKQMPKPVPADDVIPEQEVVADERIVADEGLVDDAVPAEDVVSLDETPIEPDESAGQHQADESPVAVAPTGEADEPSLEPVIFEETEELTAGLPITPDILDEPAVVLEETDELTAGPPITPDILDEPAVVLEETDELTAGLPITPETPTNDAILQDVEDAEDELIEQTSDDPAADGPVALPGYDGMTLAQVRGHLRDLSADEVSVLLRYEQDGDNRAPFLTLLSNRLVTLDAQSP